jgi:hypothetical protein
MVTIQACEVSAIVTDKRPKNGRVHNGVPTNMRLEVRQIICCITGRIDILTHSKAVN